MIFKTELDADAVAMAIKKAVLAEHPLRGLDERKIKVEIAFSKRRNGKGVVALIDIDTGDMEVSRDVKGN